MSKKTCFSVGIVCLNYNESTVLEDCAELIKRGKFEFRGGDNIKTNGAPPSLTRLMKKTQANGNVTFSPFVIGYESKEIAWQQVQPWNRSNKNRQTVILETDSYPNGMIQIKNFVCANSPEKIYSFAPAPYFFLAKKEGPTSLVNLEPTERTVASLQQLAAEALAHNPGFFSTTAEQGATDAAKELVAEAKERIEDGHMIKIVKK